MSLKFALSCAALLAAGSSFTNELEANSSNELEGLSVDAAYFKNGYSGQQNCQGNAPAPKCFEQSHPLHGEYPPAYNARGTIAVNGYCFPCSDWKISFFVDGSFLYWYGGEEGLSLGYNTVVSSGTSYTTTESTYYYQNFEYKPGFKVGLGCVTNREWVWAAEYTWLRGHTTSHISPSSSTLTSATVTPTSGTPTLSPNDWFTYLTAVTASAIESTWKYGVDLLDVTLSRPFYQGRRLTVDPSVGLRAAWIRQNMHYELTEAAGTSGGLAGITIASRNHSNSWGIGPRFGLGANYLIPWGFRFEGDMAASLLYTRYTSVSHSEDRGTLSFNPGPYTTSIHNYNCLRPMAEMGLGLGWGMYLGCQDYHLDFVASYDFTYMWNQNMMRKMLDDFATTGSASPADLYFHGLRVTGRFDF